MPRRNRVDPWGDLHADPRRGLFTGNRGCLVDENGQLVRHHNGSLWITCRTEYRGWHHPLDAPRTWTPLFFIDDAVALAAGHRPCGLCRREDYLSFREGVRRATTPPSTIMATDLNRRVATERYRQGRGLTRAADRLLWTCDINALPAGTVILDPETCEPSLMTDEYLQGFTFGGWTKPVERPRDLEVEVLTPPTSVSALRNGFVPTLHETARKAE